MSDDLPVAVHLAKGHHEPKSFPDLFAHMMCDHGEVGPHEYDELTDTELWKEHADLHAGPEFDVLAREWAEANGWVKAEGDTTNE